MCAYAICDRMCACALQSCIMAAYNADGYTHTQPRVLDDKMHHRVFKCREGCVDIRIEYTLIWFIRSTFKSRLFDTNCMRFYVSHSQFCLLMLSRCTPHSGL